MKYFGGQHRVCRHREKTIIGKNNVVRTEYFFEPQAIGDFKLGYANDLIKVGENKNGEPKFESKAEVWHTHRYKRKYERVVFEPEEKTPPDEYNLWRGFAYQP